MDTAPRPKRQRGRVVTALLAASLVAGLAPIPANAATSTGPASSSVPKLGPHPTLFGSQIGVGFQTVRTVF